MIIHLVNGPVSPSWSLGIRRVEDLRTLGLRNDLMRAYRAVGSGWWQSRILAAAEMHAACIGVFASEACTPPKASECAWNRPRRRVQR